MAKKRKKKLKKVSLGERLGRLILLAVGVVLVLGIAKALAEKQGEKPLIGEVLDLPELSIEEVEPGNVLGDVLEKGIKFNSIGEVDQETDSEPITEPVQNIEKETQTVIESIKQLPEDQIEAIKKQVFKELCEDYCQTIEEEESE